VASLSVSGICRLTRDAEVLSAGKSSWAKFGIAAFRRGAPEGRQDVDFFDVQYWLKDPESKVVSYLKKGRLIYIERAILQNDKFTGDDGKSRSKMKITIFNFDFIDSPEKVKKEEEPRLIKSEPKETKIDINNPPF